MKEECYVESTNNARSQYFLNRVEQKIWKLVLLSLYLISLPSQAGLVGTELSLRTLAQATSTSDPVVTSFERSVIVDELIVEFPDVASLFNPSTESIPGFARSLVDVAIDVGDNYIEIDFANSSPSTRFASAFENTYILKFDSVASVNIVGAEIDSSVTSLGLTTSDVKFIGNELFINVESLAFNPKTFVRINLVVENKDCIAKYSTVGSLSIPCVSVPDAFGGSIYYQANMQFVPFSNPFSFSLTGAQQINAGISESDCLAVFNTDGVLNLPCVSVPNSSGEEELFEAIMEVVPQSSPFIFNLLDVHLKN